MTITIKGYKGSFKVTGLTGKYFTKVKCIATQRGFEFPLEMVDKNVVDNLINLFRQK